MWSQFEWSNAPPFQQKLDYAGRTDGQPVYIGWATPGVQDTDAKWKIRKLTYNTDGSLSQIQFANGDVGFQQIWANRSDSTLITYK